MNANTKSQLRGQPYTYGARLYNKWKTDRNVNVQIPFIEYYDGKTLVVL